MLEPYPLSVQSEDVSRPRRGCRSPWHFVRYRRVRRKFFTHKQVAIARAAASVDALAPLPRGYRERCSVSLLSSPLAPLPRGCREGCSASLLSSPLLSRILAPLPRGYGEGCPVSLLSSPLAPLPRGCREGWPASLFLGPLAPLPRGYRERGPGGPSLEASEGLLPHPSKPDAERGLSCTIDIVAQEVEPLALKPMVPGSSPGDVLLSALRDLVTLQECLYFFGINIVHPRYKLRAPPCRMGPGPYARQ